MYRKNISLWSREFSRPRADIFLCFLIHMLEINGSHSQHSQQLDALMFYEETSTSKYILEFGLSLKRRTNDFLSYLFVISQSEY